MLESLQKGTDISAGPVTDVPLMAPICNCGKYFKDCWDCPNEGRACSQYVSNLGNDYRKLQVIPPPEIIMLFYR